MSERLMKMRRIQKLRETQLGIAELFFAKARMQYQQFVEQFEGIRSCYQTRVEEGNDALAAACDGMWRAETSVAEVLLVEAGVLEAKIASAKQGVQEAEANWKAEWKKAEQAKTLMEQYEREAMLVAEKKSQAESDDRFLVRERRAQKEIFLREDLS
ncbi:MAG: flagellar FliJ family protein [Acidobacteriaceae bacterium]|nr:flagellar FliJ family protein [Acidobacteriaceae bacterium]